MNKLKIVWYIYIKSRIKILLDTIINFLEAVVIFRSIAQYFRINLSREGYHHLGPSYLPYNNNN